MWIVDPQNGNWKVAGFAGFGVCDLTTFNPKMGTCARTACLLYIEISPMLGCLPVSLGFVPEAWTASCSPLTGLKSQCGESLHKYTYSIQYTFIIHNAYIKRLFLIFLWIFHRCLAELRVIRLGKVQPWAFKQRKIV